jgi:hypothetical protein
MATFRLTENDSVDPDDVARIEYLPASETDFITELLAEENAGDVVNPASPSQLMVVLKSGREITLMGEEADAAWATWPALSIRNSRKADLLVRRSDPIGG